MNTPLNKSKQIIRPLAVAIAASPVIFSGILKLLKSEDVMETLTKVGVAEYVNILAFMEISFAALFLVPKTRRIGFILLTCYFSGAIATELSHGGSVLNPAMPLVFVWIAVFIIDKHTFLALPKPQVQLH